MITDSLHFLVERDNNGVDRTDTWEPRRLLEVSRQILRRQNTVFNHAMRYGSDQVPFNAQRVAWAQKTKARLLRKTPAEIP